jgi:hypothetical protein
MQHASGDALEALLRAGKQVIERSRIAGIEPINGRLDQSGFVAHENTSPVGGWTAATRTEVAKDYILANTHRQSKRARTMDRWTEIEDSMEPHWPVALDEHGHGEFLIPLDEESVPVKEARNASSRN